MALPTASTQPVMTELFKAAAHRIPIWARATVSTMTWAARIGRVAGGMNTTISVTNMMKAPPAELSCAKPRASAIKQTAEDGDGHEGEHRATDHHRDQDHAQNVHDEQAPSTLVSRLDHDWAPPLDSSW
jgi:hypothetical protein